MKACIYFHSPDDKHPIVTIGETFKELMKEVIEDEFEARADAGKCVEPFEKWYAETGSKYTEQDWAKYGREKGFVMTSKVTKL